MPTMTKKTATKSKTTASKGTASKRTASKKARAKKIRQMAKGQPVPKVEHCYDVRDALKVQRAMKKFLPALNEFGLTDEEVKLFVAAIALGKKLEGTGQRLSLDKTRKDLKDLVGPYRRAARLASNGLKGRDPEKMKALRVDVAFPDNDKLLDAYVTDIGPVMKPHAAELARRKFPVAEQTKLVDAAAAFHQALVGRPDAKAAADEKSQERETAMSDLRTMTSYVREVAHSALHDSPDLSAFNRVKPTKKKTAPSEPPAPPVTPPGT